MRGGGVDARGLVVGAGLGGTASGSLCAEEDRAAEARRVLRGVGAGAVSTAVKRLAGRAFWDILYQRPSTLTHAVGLSFPSWPGLTLEESHISFPF